MKKFFIAKISALLLIAGLYSCNDSDPVFGIAEYIRYGIIDQYGSYTPCVGFGVTNGTLNTNQSQILKDGLPLSTRSLLANRLEIASQNGYSLESLNGTYRMSAYSTTEDYDVAEIKLDFEKDLGEFDYVDFQYSNGFLSMKVPQAVSNASFYGFWVKPNTGQSTDNSIFARAFYGQSYTETADINVRQALSFSELGNPESILVYPVAGLSSSGIPLYKLGEPKTLNKGATSFEEDGE